MEIVTFESRGTRLSGEFYEPALSATGIVVIAHGSDGLMEPWGAAIRAFASDLAERNFAILIPEYFTSTGSIPGMGIFSELSRVEIWTEAVSDAGRYVQTRLAVSRSQMALLGFSLGGHICLRLRASAVAVVDFFGPRLTPFGGIGSASSTEPVPVQIHHGSADGVVSISESQAIAASLRAEGSDVQFFSYEGAGHGFALPDAANATASRVSKERTLTFLKSFLSTAT